MISVHIISAAAPPFFKNGFIVSCPDSGAAIIIDPGDEVDDLIAAVQDEKWDVQMILLTHAHVDHVTGVGRAKAAFQAPVWLHRDDLFLYNAASQQAAMFGLRAEQPPPVDRFYEPDTVLSFGTCDVAVHHTPGHCPGGVCLAVTRRGKPGADLFVGDTLFAGSIGRTDLPGGDLDVLLRSIREVLFSFPDDTPVHPGHGPDTTIGTERRENPFLTGSSLA